MTRMLRHRPDSDKSSEFSSTRFQFKPFSCYFFGDLSLNVITLLVNERRGVLKLKSFRSHIYSINLVKFVQINKYWYCNKIKYYLIVRTYAKFEIFFFVFLVEIQLVSLVVLEYAKNYMRSQAPSFRFISNNSREVVRVRNVSSWLAYKYQINNQNVLRLLGSSRTAATSPCRHDELFLVEFVTRIDIFCTAMFLFGFNFFSLLY